MHSTPTGLSSAAKESEWAPTTRASSSPATTGRCSSPAGPAEDCRPRRPGWGRRRGEAGHLHQGGAYKTRNLRRDPAAVLCVVSDGFFSGWMQIEGRAQVVSLPEAMNGLVDYYRRISGEHPDWDDYQRAMQQPAARASSGLDRPAPGRGTDQRFRWSGWVWSPPAGIEPATPSLPSMRRGSQRRAAPHVTTYPRR
jgi:hypothetical protein